MSRPLLISLLWPKNAHVLVLLMQQYGFDLALPDNAIPEILRDAATAAGARILPFSAALSDGSVAMANAATGAAIRALPEIVGASGVAAYGASGISELISGAVRTKLQSYAALVEALDGLRERENVAGLLVNETELGVGKTAALWAKAHGVPSFLVSHGTGVGGAYTITKQMLADFLFVFGERGMEPYLDLGILPGQMVVTGNPAWDGYNRILASRNEYKNAVYTQLGLDPSAPLVVFATTWNAKLTALYDGAIYRNSARAFLRACQALRSRGVKVNAVIKDRPSNAQFGKAEIQALAAETGFADVKYADGDMPVFLCAADALVGYESSAFVEAMICGVPSVAIWEPSTWLAGPALGREDGIPLVQIDNPDGLADVLQGLLSDPVMRLSTISQQTARLPYFHAGNDGRAGERVAAAVAERVKTWTKAPSFVPTRNGEIANGTPSRFVWHELTSPRSVAEKGGTQEYYDHPRHELLSLLDHTPRLVLDIGCAGGATAVELRKMHPNAELHGIELSEEAAALAATRMDRILRENVEQMDFSSFGYAHGSVDTVFLPDVLEHLYNPWQLLVKLKPYLSRDAQVLASIPNVRNAWLVTQLIGGKWDYVEEGLLDVTHIRFFTLKGVIELFGQTGYSIQRLGQNVDGRMPAIDVPANGTVSVDMGGATFKNLTAQDVWELRTFQFLVDAKPVKE